MLADMNPKRELPFAGTAMPSTDMIDGQIDHKGPQGAAYVAFALP
jgi:hypothetical protein